MNDILKTNQSDTGYVYIDTCFTFDHGWETMIFECDKDGNISNFGGLDQINYGSEEEAYDGHFEIIKEWGDKFELTNETIEIDGRTLYRIRALRDFGDVKAGDLGGFIEKEENLSHEGNAWIYDEAKVFNNAFISGNAEVSDEAEVSGNAEVSGDAWVHYDAKVYGDAKVTDDAEISDYVEIYGNATVSDLATVSDYVKISGKATVSDFAKISGHAKVFDSAKISGHAKVFDSAKISGNAEISGNAKVCGMMKITGDTVLDKNRDMKLDPSDHDRPLSELLQEAGNIAQDYNQNLEQTIDISKNDIKR